MHRRYPLLKSNESEIRCAPIAHGDDAGDAPRVVYDEKCTVYAVDDAGASDCNASMGRRARRQLARRVRILRLLRGWTQEELADECGLHRTFVSLVERGQCNISLDNLERLAQAFELGVPELFAMLDMPRRARSSGGRNGRRARLRPC